MTSHIQCVCVCYVFTVFVTDVGILGSVCHNNSRFTVKLKVFRHLPQLRLSSNVYTQNLSATVDDLPFSPKAEDLNIGILKELDNRTKKCITNIMTDFAKGKCR